MDAIYKFLQIPERLRATEFSSGNLLVLETLLKEVVKSKSHFLLHHPFMINMFWPLVKTFFKSLLGLSKNRKNISQAMAKKNQMFMCLHYQNQNLFCHNEPVANESFMPYEQKLFQNQESIKLFSTDLLCQINELWTH